MRGLQEGVTSGLGLRRAHGARSALGVAALALLVCGASAAHAQCGWSAAGNQSIAGITQSVEKMTTWDPDGAGPIAPRVVIAGSVTLGGTTPLAGIAWWDTQTSSWQSLQPPGAGDSDRFSCVPGEACFSTINSIFTIGTTLVIAGNLFIGRDENTVNDESGIAYWTGTRWRGVGTGAPFADRGLPSIAQAAGGNASSIFAACTDGLWVLTGSLETGTWERVNADFQNAFTTEMLQVESNLVRFRRTEGDPDANGVERYSSGDWLPFGGDTTGLSPTDAFIDPSGTLYVAFSSLGGSELTLVRKLQGNTFVDVGSPMIGTVSQLAMRQGVLYAVGSISETAGGSTRGFARFAGDDWEPAGTSTLSEDRPGFGFRSQVRAAAGAGNLLFVGGTFLEAGSTPVANVAAFDGTNWLATPGGGNNGAPSVLKFDASGNLLAAGFFSKIGGVSASNIARFNPQTSTWSALGEGLPETPPDIESWMSPDGERIIAGTTPVRSWDGTQWQEFGTPVVTNPLFEGINRIQQFEGDLLLLGRSMRFQFGTLRWDGSDWGPFVGNGPFDSVYSIARFGDRVIGGGSFPDNDFFFNAGVNQISPGNEWTDFVEEVPPFLITQLVPYNNTLVAVGSIARAGFTNIESWDGTAWSLLGGGTDGPVLAATVYRGDLVVGGLFSREGNVPVKNLARWDGTRWSAFPVELRTAFVGSSIDGIAALAVQGDSLYVAGTFADATLGFGIARWTDCETVSCDGIDFNGDGLFPSDDDLTDFLVVLAGGTCSTPTCADIDFNNDGLFPSDDDLLAFLRVLAGGECGG
jgi:hypothetical protein